MARVCQGTPETVSLRRYYNELSEIYKNAAKGTFEKISAAANGEAAAQAAKNKKAPDGERVQRSGKTVDSFTKDKYYERNIDRWKTLPSGANIKVGTITIDGVLNQTGIPAVDTYYDISKINLEMKKHGDHLDNEILKGIPRVLSDPIAVAEYRPGSNTNTVNIWGELFTKKGKPILIGLVVSKGTNKNTVTKIRTSHMESDLSNKITDESILYLNPDKRKTKAWFRLSGNDVPLEGKRFGLIRSIRLNDSKVKGKEQKSRKMAETEREYLELAKDPVKNEARLREMVREAARAAGYDSPLLFHGTDSFGFTVFRTQRPYINT